MDVDTYDGPFTVWQMFNAPTMVLFNNLEHAADGLNRLLTSILKLSGDFSEVLVPKPGSTKCPDTYYCAFNTWLLGRLFYVCSVKELERIHIASKDAQVKILNILCVNSASFYEKLMKPFHSILDDLVKYYNENIDRDVCGEIVLNYFLPEQIQIPDVELNLEPINVHVKNLSMCTSLMNIVLQILSECIPPSLLYINRNFGNLNKLFSQVLFMLENFSMEVKLFSLNFFSNLIPNVNNSSGIYFQTNFPLIYKQLLGAIESTVLTLNMLVDHNSFHSNQIANINIYLLKIIKTFDNILIKEHNEIISTICNIILKETVNNIFSKDLKLYCLSISDKIDLSSDILEIERRNAHEIDMLTECYCKKILENIYSRKGYDEFDINQDWYAKQVFAVINSLEYSEEINKDVNEISYNLNRCLSALGILHQVSIRYKRNSDCSINLFNVNHSQKLWETLSKIVKKHDCMLLGDGSCLSLFLNIILVTASLTSSTLCGVNLFSSSKINVLLQVLCLQNSVQTLDSVVRHNDNVKVQILKYILVSRIILNIKENVNFDRITLLLLNSIIKNKNVTTYKEIIALCPFLVLCKVSSASKLIGEILMPAFLTKNCEVQTQLTSVLPEIACMSMGKYSIILENCNRTGHSIFKNKVLDLSLVCCNCHNYEKKQHDVFSLEFNKENIEICRDEFEMTPSQQSILNGLRSLFAKFLNWKAYSNIENAQFWSLLERLCNHYNVFDYGVPTELINNENIHHSLKALKTFIYNSTFELGNDGSQKHDIFSLCISILIKRTQASLDTNNHNQQSDTLNLIKEFGLYSNKQAILPVTKLFIYFIMDPQCTLAPKAVVYLREICEFHSFTPNQVYHRYKKDYCRLFVDCSLYSGKDFAMSLLKVVRAFGFVGYRDFISKDVHHFLPYLIPYSATVKEVPSMIEEIASLVQCSVSEFIVERFPLIYVHVYLNETNAVSDKCYTVLERLTKCSILSLIKKHFRVILTEFLLQYCSNPEKVLNACRYLACHDPDVSTPTGNMRMSTTQIADFLNPKFLGVLAYFDHKLVNAKVALSVKRKALKSFPDMMQLMGVKYITPLRFKVLATLRSALPLVKEFPKILAEAWAAFIHNIDSISLGPLLSNLAVSLLQQFDHAPQEINKIFQYLVLKNENLLSTHLSDLFFLEDSKISEKVKVVIKRHVRMTQPEEFLDKMKWYLEHLNHEIPTIKAYAFTHLDKLLKNNRTEIHKAIFGGRNIDPVVVELIDCLLLGCKDPDRQVREASGSCLGQLGAIEAGHLPRQYVQPDRSPFAFTIVDNCFAATALVELSRAFQYEKDTTNHGYGGESSLRSTAQDILLCQVYAQAQVHSVPLLSYYDGTDIRHDRSFEQLIFIQRIFIKKNS